MMSIVLSLCLASTRRQVNLHHPFHDSWGLRQSLEIPIYIRFYLNLCTIFCCLELFNL